MHPRHVAILTEIDDTLVHHLISKDRILWNGGGVDNWRRIFAAMTEAGKRKNILFHFGIATSRPEYLNEEYRNYGLKSDYVYAAVVEDPTHLTTYENDPIFVKNNIKKDCGLKAWIDTNLIFFSNNQSKIPHCLDKTVKTLEEKNIAIDKKDCWLLETNDSVRQEAKQAGFSESNAALLSRTTKPSAALAELFLPIFKRYGIEDAFPELKEGERTDLENIPPGGPDPLKEENELLAILCVDVDVDAAAAPSEAGFFSQTNLQSSARAKSMDPEEGEVKKAAAAPARARSNST